MKKVFQRNMKALMRKIRLPIIVLEAKKLSRKDNRRFLQHSFIIGYNIKKCDQAQLEAQILKTQHSIEKGLSLKNTRLGFGLSIIDLLESLLLEYIDRGNSIESEAVKISLDTMNEYVDFHRRNNHEPKISFKLHNLLQSINPMQEKHGGFKDVSRNDVISFRDAKFESFVKSRYSIRDFADTDVDIDVIKEAINIALNTPSACNRQSWNVRIVSGSYIGFINDNQNGNRGFGEKINKYLIVTSDLKSFSKPRERNQAFIDGGLFAMNLLLALHHKGLATIPMSASLNAQQESNIRNKFELNDSEVLIMFIALGHYPQEFKVAFSKRKKLNPKIFLD